jgi:hypothetical protein
MFTLDKDALNKNQYDILTTEVTSNEYLSSSDVIAANKTLTTTKKAIIPAINEVYQQTVSIQDSLKTSLDQQLNIIGDSLNNAELATKLHAIGENIIDALDKLNKLTAKLESPTLTGTPLAPTAIAGTNTTQIATTEFVNTAITNGTSKTTLNIPTSDVGGNIWIS